MAVMRGLTVPTASMQAPRLVRIAAGTLAMANPGTSCTGRDARSTARPAVKPITAGCGMTLLTCLCRGNRPAQINALSGDAPPATRGATGNAQPNDCQSQPGDRADAKRRKSMTFAQHTGDRRSKKRPDRRAWRPWRLRGGGGGYGRIRPIR